MQVSLYMNASPCRLQTQLTPAQEMVMVYQRHALLLPFNNLLTVTHVFISESVSRLGLGWYLRRRSVSILHARKIIIPA